MKDILNVVLMTLSGVIIILTLLQSGKSDGLSAAFTGSGDLNLFAVQKERGPEKVISRLTLFCGILFFAIDRIADCVIKRPLRSFFCFKGGKNERKNHSIFRRKKRM